MKYDVVGYFFILILFSLHFSLHFSIDNQTKKNEFPILFLLTFP